MEKEVPHDESETDLVEECQDKYRCSDRRRMGYQRCGCREGAGVLDVRRLNDIWLSRFIVLVRLRILRHSVENGIDLPVLLLLAQIQVG